MIESVESETLTVFIHLWSDLAISCSTSIHNHSLLYLHPSSPQFRQSIQHYEFMNECGTVDLALSNIKKENGIYMRYVWAVSWEKGVVWASFWNMYIYIALSSGWKLSSHSSVATSHIGTGKVSQKHNLLSFNDYIIIYTNLSQTFISYQGPWW